MAYASRFYFIFHGASGDYYKIDILQDGFSGTALRRNLGGEPVLRRERNGNICGSSLEFLAECEVDEEFSILYTTNPVELMVQLKRAATVSALDTTSEDPSLVSVIWQGFIATEMYSAPYIDPPYDVKVIATDGLGELKNQTITFTYRAYFNIPRLASATWTIADWISEILEKSGSTLPLAFVNTIKTGSDLLETFHISPAQWGDKTYYAALEDMMTYLHARIFQCEINGAATWLVVRETDIINRMNQGTVIPDGYASGTYDALSVKTVGSAQSYAVFPIDKLTETISPAKSGLTLKERPNYYNVVTSGWSNGSVTISSISNRYWRYNYYRIAGLYNAVVTRTQPWHLQIKMRNANSYSVRVEFAIGFYCDSTWYYLTNNGWITASNYYDAPYNNQGLLINAAVHDDIRDIQTFDFEHGPENIGLHFRPTQISIWMWSPDGMYLRDVEANLYAREVDHLPGIDYTLKISNSGRFAGDDVSYPFCQGYIEPDLFFLMNGNNKASTFTSDNDSTADSLPRVILKDYGLSVALPRLRMEGAVNWPYGYNPFLFAIGGINFNVETFDWAIRAGEVSFSALSLPATSMTITSITTTEITD